MLLHNLFISINTSQLRHGSRQVIPLLLRHRLLRCRRGRRRHRCILSRFIRSQKDLHIEVHLGAFILQLIEEWFNHVHYRCTEASMGESIKPYSNSYALIVARAKFQECIFVISSFFSSLILFWVALYFCWTKSCGYLTSSWNFVIEGSL